MLPQTVRGGDDLYRALLELSAEAIALVELAPPLAVDGPVEEQVEHILRAARIAECNDAYARLHGRRDASEVAGQALAGLMPAAERREIVRRFVNAGYRLVDGEMSLSRSDGSTRWALGNALGSPEGGRLARYWITLHDISARKQVEAHHAGRDRILEGVAFGAARLLESGTWESHAQEVIANLGEATGAGRVTLAQVVDGPDGSAHVRYRFLWGAAGLEVSLEDPRVRGGISTREMGLDRIEGELRAGRAVCALVRELAESERAFYEGLGSKSFAAVPILAAGRYWGFLGVTESRYERAWSIPEVDALKTAAAMFGAAIERDRAAAERQRADRMLEAVAFGAARLLEPGTWEPRAEEVLARLGEATGAGRITLGDVIEDAAGVAVMRYRFQWVAPGRRATSEDPLIRGGFSVREAGLQRVDGELRAGRPVCGLVSALPAPERSFFESVESKSIACVPVVTGGRYWGFLGVAESRYDRTWSHEEVEALKAAAAVFGGAIERARADTSLRESEERFKRLSAAAFEGIALTERGLFIDSNDQLARMLGSPIADLVGRSVSDFVAPEDRAELQSHLASGSEEPYQLQALRADGTVFPVEVRSRAIPYDGRTVRVSAIRDMSERMAAEERQRHLEADLRQAAEEWRQTFDALDLGIVLVDDEDRIVRLNRAALVLGSASGYADLVGRRLEDLARGEPWRRALELCGRVADGRRTVVDETIDPETRRSYYLLASPWLRQEGARPWCVLSVRDVTALATMQAQLRRARTLEAMGSLVAGVAHEVRNPLFSISATVDALESELGRRPEFADYAVLLRSQVGRLTQLMRDLLDYGRPAGLSRGPVRLVEVIRRAVRTCAALARERQVRVEESVDTELPSLDAEGARLEQALENLIANAVQHAPAQTSVRVRAWLDGAPGAPVVRCTVEDDGPGMAAGELERIFEPFFSRRKGGTGLGLPIVQRVAEAHGGSATAENRDEGGARFTLLLPVGSGTKASEH